MLKNDSYYKIISCVSLKRNQNLKYKLYMVSEPFFQIELLEYYWTLVLNL